MPGPHGKIAQTGGISSSDSELEAMSQEEKSVAASQMVYMAKHVNSVGRILKDPMLEVRDEVDGFVATSAASECSQRQKRKLCKAMKSMLNEGRTTLARIENSVEERIPTIEKRVGTSHRIVQNFPRRLRQEIRQVGKRLWMPP